MKDLHTPLRKHIRAVFAKLLAEEFNSHPNQGERAKVILPFDSFKGMKIEDVPLHELIN